MFLGLEELLFILFFSSNVDVNLFPEFIKFLLIAGIVQRV